MPPARALPVPTPPPPLPAPRAVPAAQADADFFLGAAMAASRAAGAVAALGPIVQNPAHPRFRDAVLALALLGRELPEGADVERWFGAVSEASAPALVAATPAAAEAVLYFVGRSRYDSWRYDEAASALAKVTRDPLLAPRAQLLLGAANVRLRRSVPAVQAMQRALASLDAAPPGADRVYLRDAAHLAIAQTFYAAAFRPNENDVLAVDSSKLSAFVKYAEMIDPSSPLWPEAAFELAWAFLLAGDHVRAGGHARALSGSPMPSARAAEARLLEANVLFANCRYDEVEAKVVPLVRRWSPVHARLSALVEATRGARREDAFFNTLASFRDGRLAIDPEVGLEVGFVLADRAVARRLAYVARLDGEAARPPAAAGVDPARARALTLAERARAAAAASDLIRERLEAQRDALAEVLASSAEVLRLVTAARRNQLDGAIAATLTTVAESSTYGVLRPARPQLYPFARALPDDVRRYGTGWFYAPVSTKCGR